MSITTRAALLRFLDEIDPAIQGRVGELAATSPIDSKACEAYAQTLRTKHPTRLAAVDGSIVESWVECFAGLLLGIDVEARPFDRKRAYAIWAARGLQNSITMSPDEDAYVRAVWATMPGSTCYMDAFFRILRGFYDSDSRSRLAEDVLAGHAPSATPADRAAGQRAQIILHAMNRDTAQDAQDAEACADCIRWLSLMLRGERVGL